jgi:ABC-type uncharacterized transport system permease subunit
MLIAFLPHIFAIISTLLLFIGINDLNYHIVIALISYALLFSAFLLSFILDYQQRKLHSHNINTFIDKLPALQTTEKILFATIYLGFIVLSITIVNGFLTMQDMFAQHLVHKTILALLSWVVLFVLIATHLGFGLRDKKAILAVQIAFILIIIGYFGTKLALFLLK